jgi:chemotaxis protein CheZ
MSDADMSGDSRELEALFDSIAAGVAVRPRRRRRTCGPSLMQQLREVTARKTTATSCRPCSIRSSPRARRPAAAARDAAEAAPWQGRTRCFQRVGQMARQLHDTLGQLGYHELLESTVAAIPTPGTGSTMSPT